MQRQCGQILVSLLSRVSFRVSLTGGYLDILCIVYVHGSNDIYLVLIDHQGSSGASRLHRILMMARCACALPIEQASQW